MHHHLSTFLLYVGGAFLSRSCFFLQWSTRLFPKNWLRNEKMEAKNNCWNKLVELDVWISYQISHSECSSNVKFTKVLALLVVIFTIFIHFSEHNAFFYLLQRADYHHKKNVSCTNWNSSHPDLSVGISALPKLVSASIEQTARVTVWPRRTYNSPERCPLITWVLTGFLSVPKFCLFRLGQSQFIKLT